MNSKFQNYIAVVEDDPEFLELALDYLKSMEFRVIGFASSAKALESLRSGSLNVEINAGRVPVILSDYFMPDMDGLTFLKLMKKDFPELPFVMMTAFGSKETELTARTAGALEFILKPFSFSQVESILLQALGSTQNHSSKAQLPKEEQCENCGNCACDAIERKTR